MFHEGGPGTHVSRIFLSDDQNSGAFLMLTIVLSTLRLNLPLHTCSGILTPSNEPFTEYPG